MKKATNTRSTRKRKTVGNVRSKARKTLFTEAKLNENIFIIFMAFMVFVVFITYIVDSNKKEYDIKNGTIDAKEIFGELPKDFSDYNDIADNNVFGNTKVSRNVYYSMVLARKLELYKNGDITKEEYVRNVKKYNALINK